MVFHVVALPHTNVSKEHSACAFNQKVLKFCKMMRSLNHTVYLYSSEKHEADVDEHITCLSEEKRVASLKGKHYTQASFDWKLPHWVEFNNNAIAGIEKRIGKKDFICVIGGLAHKPIADAFPNHQTVEFGIGYGGTFSNYRVFESYAWMHIIYGSQQGINSSRGIWFDDVIPNYFEIDEFGFQSKKDDYYLYIGRLADDKGFNIAIEACKRMNKRLVIAGPGDAPSYGEYKGVVGPEERTELMKNAQAVFTPSIYVEPFCSVAVEAQLCGTPVISTDWGAFTETVVHGETGFRCRTLQEFIDAMENVKKLDYKAIRERAIKKYSMEVIKYEYENYFKRLLTLWEDGWYQVKN